MIPDASSQRGTLAWFSAALVQEHCPHYNLGVTLGNDKRKQVLPLRQAQPAVSGLHGHIPASGGETSVLASSQHMGMLLLHSAHHDGATEQLCVRV